MVKVLFVCLGNICRSPLVEGIFKDLVKKERLQEEIFVDSAGTSNYHIGKPAHVTSQKVANKHGIELTSRGRQFTELDFEEFDYILALDSNNYYDILDLSDGKYQYTNEVKLLREYDNSKSKEDVQDPYGYPEHVFEEVYSIMNECAINLLAEIKNKYSL